ncbi:MAG: DUF3500 domain-containing protein [Planctomycetes bacterium]|nr:DUF3500 domain-containing protein [Planctomycetota bacterium]
MQHGLSLAVTILLTATSGVALWPQPVHAAGGAEAVAAAASAFLGKLSPEQRQLAQRALDDAERTSWNFVPGRYAGIELGALDAAQDTAARALLASMLSTAGFAKVTAITRLEDVLRAIESAGGHDASHRDPGRYALLVCGEPAAAGTFMVRFQGHHVSLQVSVHEGAVVSCSPRFLGTNPAEVPSGERRGQRVLGAEEDLARAFLLMLDEAQLQRAVIAATAPADVLLGPGQAPAKLGARRGVAWKDLDDGQRAVLWRLVEEFAHVLRSDVADGELARIKSRDLDELSFAWAGGRERGQGHYYRIHGTFFAVEYDNTQNGANHVHTVWRDFEHDFGGDLLRKHLREQHGR